MQHYKISDDLYLVQQTIPGTLADQPKHEITNHLWFVDRSGSMHWLLPDLISQLQQVIYKIPVGDTLTFGYFSSEGMYRIVIKGFQLNSPDDYDKLKQLLNEHKRSLSLTCFSEILTEADQVIEDLAFISRRSALWFFTDGYPVVNNYRKEIDSIKSALSKLSGRLVASAFIGYGDFYNNELLSDMAAWSGGIAIHSSELPTAIENLQTFTEEASRQAPRQLVQLPAGATLAFHMTENGVVSYKPDSCEEVCVPASVNDYYLWVLCTQPHGMETKPLDIQPPDVPLYDLTVDQWASKIWVSAIYATASILLPSTPYIAEDLMAAIGDVHFINALASAFSVEEYGTLVKQLQAAAVDEDERFVDSWRAGFKPDPEAFCILDLVDLLTQDADAYFFPYHQDFKYKRIGAPSKTKEGYPEFLPDRGQACSFSDMVWHSSKLNLSIRTRINGIVDLSAEAGNFKLPQYFNTHVTRTYTIINDGALWLTQLPVAVSEATWKKLSQEGLIESGRSWVEDQIYTLDLTKLPLINRAIASLVETNITASQVGSMALHDALLGAKLKVYKELLKQELGDESKLPDTFTPEQKEFLESKGIKEYGFSPPSTKENSGDYYLAKTFDIAVSGFSSLPKVSDVAQKVEKKAKLNAPGVAMADALQEAKVQLLTAPDYVFYLKSEIGSVKAQQARLRHSIQRCKFSLLLGKRWFKDLDRENPVVTLPDAAGTKVTFKFGETKVEV